MHPLLETDKIRVFDDTEWEIIYLAKKRGRHCCFSLSDADVEIVKELAGQVGTSMSKIVSIALVKLAKEWTGRD